jgi:hypothetical protein
MSKLERVLTPDEVRALQRPHVQREVQRINDALLKGYRSPWVPAPLFEDVAMLLRSSGWVIENAHLVSFGTHMAFELREPRDDDAAALGAAVLATRAERS